MSCLQIWPNLSVNIVFCGCFGISAFKGLILCIYTGFKGWAKINQSTHNSYNKIFHFKDSQMKDILDYLCAKFQLFWSPWVSLGKLPSGGNALNQPTRDRFLRITFFQCKIIFYWWNNKNDVAWLCILLGLKLAMSRFNKKESAASGK